MKKTPGLLISWLLSTALFYTFSIGYTIVQSRLGDLKYQGTGGFAFTPVVDRWAIVIAMVALWVSAVLGVVYLSLSISRWKHRATLPGQRNSTAGVMTALLWVFGTPLFLIFFLLGLLMAFFTYNMQDYKYIQGESGQTYILVDKNNIDSHDYYQYKKVAPGLMMADRPINRSHWQAGEYVPPDAPLLDW